MGIELYQKACIVKKADKFYYMLKHHSKNDAICGGQSIIDDTFHTKWLRRTSRSGSWRVIAHGTQTELENDTIADTSWNAPTSWIYGRIMFANKKNIALYYAKNKDNYIVYEDLDEEQQQNIDKLLEWQLRDGNSAIDLSKLLSENKMKPHHGYVGNVLYNMIDHSITYNGKLYWNLDNL